MGTDQQFINDYIAKQNAIYNTPIDEAAIRSQKEAEMQAQIDAINKVYADKLNQSRIQGQGRTGTNVAQQARGGLLGSDFGTAQQNQIQDVNTQSNNLVEAERLSLVNALLADAQNNAAAEIANKRSAVEAGGKALLEYYAWAEERKSTKTKGAAQKLLALGKLPTDVTDAELKQMGLSRQDLTIEYTTAKQAQEAAQAQAQAEQQKTSLENAKTQAEIDQIKWAIQKAQAEGSKYYEVGNKIYEMGTNKFISNAEFNPYSGAFQVSQGNQVYNPVTGQFSTPPVPWSITWDLRQYASQYPNEASLKNNNPAGITFSQWFSDRLTQAWIQFQKWTNRPANEGWSYFWFPSIEEGMKAYDLLWSSPGYTGLTLNQALNRWNTGSTEKGYGTQISWEVGINGNTRVSDLSPEQLRAIQMAQLKRESPWMYKVLTSGQGGGQAGLSDLAQSVQKGIITIAQIPAAQRTAVARELASSGASTPKTQEIQRNIDLVDALLNSPSVNTISGNIQGRLPWIALGWDAQLALNQYEQIKNLLSLDSREKLKGTGAISDFESKMLANSASAIGRNLSDKDFKAELQKIRDIFDGKYKYLTNESDIKNTQNTTTNTTQNTTAPQSWTTSSGLTYSFK